MYEIDVFKDFTDDLMSTQQQLHNTYHTERQLRDRLLTAVDVPSLQEIIADRQPRTAHQLIEQVANSLSERPRSAGSTVAHLSGNPSQYFDETEALGVLNIIFNKAISSRRREG